MLAVRKNGKPYCIMYIYFCFEWYLLLEKILLSPQKLHCCLLCVIFSAVTEFWNRQGHSSRIYWQRLFFYRKYLMLALTGFHLDCGWKLEQNYFFHYVYSQTKFLSNVIKIVSNAISTLTSLQILKRLIYIYI